MWPALMNSVRHFGLVVIFLAGSGCGGSAPAPAPAPAPNYYDDGYGVQTIAFLPEAQSNAATDVGLSDLTLTRPTGESVKVRELSGMQGVVVVVTRGNTNPICPYCSTQTAHYIRDYEEFRRRGIEVVIVYPIEVRADNARLEAFLTDARTRIGDPKRPVPFPVLFDVELTAVDQLGIRKDLSKPATYILNAAGEVQYAYVGAHFGDRPAVSAVLSELDQRGLSAAAAPTAAAPGGETPAVVNPAVPPSPGN
jgi:peroxiredoxin